MAFLAKLKTCSGEESMTCFHNLMFDGRTVSLTVLAMTPWDFRPRKCSSDSLFCEALKMEEAPLRSRLSNNESARIFGWFVTSQSSLMLAFLLDLRRCLLVSFSLAALCAKVGIPSPQKVIGELAHSVTHELGGNSSHSLMCFVHNLSIVPDRNASVKLYIFSSVLHLIFKEEFLTSIFSSLVKNSFFGTSLCE